MSGVAESPAPQPALWLASWATSQQIPEPHNALPPAQLTNSTLRQIVHLSAGGTAVRIRLSNAFGTQPLHIAGVHLAFAASPSSPALTPNSDHPILFAGQPSVTIPAGAEYISDPLPIPIPALSDLAISILFTDPPSPETGHPGSRATSWLLPGDHLADPSFTPATPADLTHIDHWYQLTGVDVFSANPTAATLVTLGDSITDGHGATTNGNDRWPDDLARRLQSAGLTAIAVSNQGIGGNHLLTDGLGPNTLARLDRDLLAQPGVRWVILLEGINDLGGLSRQPDSTPAQHAALVAQIIAAYSQIIARAHAQGIQVFGATLTPWLGSDYYHPDPAAEADRQAVNQWIRSAPSSDSHFDAVLDFDLALRDPAQPSRILPTYDCGDHLHPNPAGYQALANSIPLSLFQPRH